MGNVGEAEQAANQAAEREDTSSLFAIIARGIRAFDLLPDGDILVTHGTMVERIDKNGKREELQRTEDIMNIVAL